MTIPVAVPNYYTGNGSTADYDYDFLIRVDTDILATVRHPTTGVETKLVLTTDYTVSGEGESSGGQISLVDNGQAWLDDDGYLDDSWILSIRRKRPLTQETDIRNQGDFFPEAHEDQFDNLAMVDQQQQEELDKSVKFPETVDKDDFDPTLPADLVGAAGATIIVNDDGDGFEEGPTADQISGAQAAATAADAAQAAAEAAQTAAEAAQAAAEAAAAQFTKADQATMEAGVNDVNYATSLGVKQAIRKHKTRVGTVAIATGVLAIDAALYDVVNVTANADFTLNMPTNGEAGDRITVRITQDATGSRVLTLGSGINIPSELAEDGIVLSTAAASVDKIGLYCVSASLWEIDAFTTDYSEPA